MQINKAKGICECLIVSEGIDLKFEESFCLLLLGQVHFESWFPAAIIFSSLPNLSLEYLQHYLSLLLS